MRAQTLLSLKAYPVEFISSENRLNPSGQNQWHYNNDVIDLVRRDTLYCNGWCENAGDYLARCQTEAVHTRNWFAVWCCSMNEFIRDVVSACTYSSEGNLIMLKKYLVAQNTQKCTLRATSFKKIMWIGAQKANTHKNVTQKPDWRT